MDSAVQLAFVVVALIVGLSLLPWVVYILVRLLSATYGTVAGAVVGSFQVGGEQFGAWLSERSILAQASAVAKASRRRRGTSPGAANPEVYTLAELLRRAVAGCNSIHHYAADALGVERMEELADHTVCAAYRDRVVQITDTALDRLARSDLVGDAVVAKMFIGLDRMRDMCTDCVLLRYTHQDAPRLCDPAIHMGCTEKDEK